MKNIACSLVEPDDQGGADRVALDRTTSETERGIRCPRCRRIVSRKTGEVFEKSCGSWACPVCAGRKAWQAQRTIEEGIAQALTHSVAWHHVVLTGRADATVSPYDFTVMFRALRRMLAEVGRFEYVVVLHACTDRTRGVHGHVVLVGDAVPTVPVLERMVRRSGFGQQCHVRAGGTTLDDGARLAVYLTRQLPWSVRSMRHPGSRVRPVRRSMGWPDPPKYRPAREGGR
jgi:hypothetical protein